MKHPTTSEINSYINKLHDYIEAVVKATREKAIKECIEALKLEKKWWDRGDFTTGYNSAVEDLEFLTKGFLEKENI